MLLRVAHIVVKAGTWKEATTKAFHLEQYPYWVCLFHSAICFVLHLFQFVYIWPLLERDSLLIYCPCFLRVALRVHKAPRPQALLSHCVASLLASVTETGQRKALPKHHKDLTRKKKPQPHEGLRDSAASQCSFVWIVSAVGMFAAHRGLFVILGFHWNCFSF